MSINISMAIYDTAENGRHKYTVESVEKSILQHGIHKRHQVYLILNDCCQETIAFARALPKEIKVIEIPTNIGTARAINRGWQYRQPQQHAIKMDNDVVITESNWVEQMVEVLERMPSIGILGLKRKDLIQTTWAESKEHRVTLYMVPQKLGQRWYNIEETQDIIGTCVLVNSKLLNKIGYLYQPGLYGYDDVILSYRSRISGFLNAFLPHIEIEHIDTGEGAYIQQKRDVAAYYASEVKNYVNDLLRRKKPLYTEFY